MKLLNPGLAKAGELGDGILERPVPVKVKTVASGLLNLAESSCSVCDDDGVLTLEGVGEDGDTDVRAETSLLKGKVFFARRVPRNFLNRDPILKLPGLLVDSVGEREGMVCKVSRLAGLECERSCGEEILLVSMRFRGMDGLQDKPSTGRLVLDALFIVASACAIFSWNSLRKSASFLSLGDIGMCTDEMSCDS